MDDVGSRAGDDRDARTQQGGLPQGDRMGAPSISSAADEYRSLPVAQDPAQAVNSAATPSDYSLDEIEGGQTPLSEGMDRLIDPGIGDERLSTNPDVLDLDSVYLEESEEPSFMQDPGTTDIIQVIEEGETYFPPTDPVLRVSRNQDAEIMGGFAGTSLEEPVDPEDHPLQVQSNDDEIAEQVRYALMADAYTADLNIEVEVEDGTVFLHGKVGSLDDIEQAEQVAGSVPGVEEVEEDLEIV